MLELPARSRASVVSAYARRKKLGCEEPTKHRTLIRVRLLDVHQRRIALLHAPVQRHHLAHDQHPTLSSRYRTVRTARSVAL